MMLLRGFLLTILSVTLLAFAGGMRIASPGALAASEADASRFEDRFSSGVEVGLQADDARQSLHEAVRASDAEANRMSSASVTVDKKLTTGGVGLYVSDSPLDNFLARTEGGIQRWSGVAMQAADANGIPREFLLKLLSQESGFKPTSISRAGALGIAQFMPATAIAVGLKDPFEPVSAIHAAAAHLATLVKRFGNLGLAAAAYNAGPERVSAWLSGRRGLPEETRNYVRRVTGLDAESWATPRTGLIMNASNATAVAKPGGAHSGRKPSSRRSASVVNLCQAINSTGATCRVQTSY
jgi:soluble lytic murein transglycosylase-like protein